jgi:hypothetical protein
MCIRALDYSPPTDITFGEFLRAIITADCDVVEDDRFNYRVSFVEAFQRRGIFPPGVRTLSVGSLKWRSIEEEDFKPSDWLKEQMKLVRHYSTEVLYANSRKEIFSIERKLRLDLHDALVSYFKGTDGAGRKDAEFLGIDPDQSFEVHAARVAFRPRPDGGISPQLLVGLLQATRKPVDPDDQSGPTMQFEGGCSIVADLYEGRLRYCIRKGLSGTRRLGAQQTFAMQEFSSLRSTYLGARPLNPGGGVEETFALIHRC